jgi:hypothetical protein
MKFGLPIALLAVAVEAAPQLGGFGSSLSLVGTKQGKPVIRATAKRTTFRFGPIDLAGKDVSFIDEVALL